ncbi:MAG: hypothetical protein IKN72_00375 [Clostridia bacterium]|nr:hypothetical protein [Clostridia bacterium]MBR3551827.1 hypothetical protein [Clostridia bacterium]
MIGLGTWSAKVNALMMTFEGTVEIRDKGGEYEFIFHLPDRFKGAQIRTFDIVEDGNTLRGKGEVSLFPGKFIETEVTFDGDKMTGKITVPFLGNSTFKIKDGHRIA